MYLSLLSPYDDHSQPTVDQPSVRSSASSVACPALLTSCGLVTMPLKCVPPPGVWCLRRPCRVLQPAAVVCPLACSHINLCLCKLSNPSPLCRPTDAPTDRRPAGRTIDWLRYGQSVGLRLLLVFSPPPSTARDDDTDGSCGVATWRPSTVRVPLIRSPVQPSRR
jgi:hypothetical protein